jgi:hypothetical protein
MVRYEERRNGRDRAGQRRSNYGDVMLGEMNMVRLRMGVVLIAGCLCLAQAAPAQFGPPPTGPNTLPEPIPFGSESAPNLTTAPSNPFAEPQGVPTGVPSLPDDGTGAFPCKEIEPERAWYFHIGAQLYQRQGLAGSGGLIAVFDPQNLDTGLPAAPGGAVAQKLGDLKPRFDGGVRATFGYLWDNQAVELTGYYITQSNRSTGVSAGGRIDGLFFNAPLGFEGDNGLWLQADRMATTFSSELYSIEANYRYSDAAVHGAELIAGLRYFDLRERLSTTTDDDGIAFPLVHGQPDPTRVATYSVGTRNHFIGPQLGFEYDKSCNQLFTLGFIAKASLGANFVDADRSLVRGDGYQGFNGQRSFTEFSHMYEMNAFVDIHLLERAKLRVGYNTMWFLHMASVSDQYDLNLQTTNQFPRQNGNVFFHGPQVEFEFLF